MSDREREAARIGMQVLNDALTALGYKPAPENTDFRIAEPVVGDIPNTILDKPGVAPLRFVFGLELDVWVGPFSEVLTLDVSDAAKDEAQRRIEKLLRSSVECRMGRWFMNITLRLPREEPWLRLKVGASGYPATLEPVYAPYAR